MIGFNRVGMSTISFRSSMSFALLCIWYSGFCLFVMYFGKHEEGNQHKPVSNSSEGWSIHEKAKVVWQERSSRFDHLAYFTRRAIRKGCMHERIENRRKRFITATSCPCTIHHILRNALSYFSIYAQAILDQWCQIEETIRSFVGFSAPMRHKGTWKSWDVKSIDTKFRRSILKASASFRNLA